MQLNTKLILAGLLSIPSLASADPSSITFDGIGLGNDYVLNYNHQTEDVFVGGLNFNTNTSPTQFTSFCVDLDHFISTGQTYSISPIQTNTLASGNAYKLAGDILSAGSGTLTDANHAAAMQIAVWTAVYGKQFSLGGVSSTVQSLEQSYYNAGLKTDANALYFQQTGGVGQSQIATTPEPATMAFMGLGAFGFLLRRKRS